MLGDGLQALNGETYHKFTAQQFARQATKLDNGIQIMATPRKVPRRVQRHRRGMGAQSEGGNRTTAGQAWLLAVGGARTEASGHDHGGSEAGHAGGATAVGPQLHWCHDGQDRDSEEASEIFEYSVADSTDDALSGVGSVGGGRGRRGGAG